MTIYLYLPFTNSQKDQTIKMRRCLAVLVWQFIDIIPIARGYQESFTLIKSAQRSILPMKQIHGTNQPCSISTFAYSSVLTTDIKKEVVVNLITFSRSRFLQRTNRTNPSLRRACLCLLNLVSLGVVIRKANADVPNQASIHAENSPQCSLMTSEN